MELENPDDQIRLNPMATHVELCGNCIARGVFTWLSPSHHSAQLLRWTGNEVSAKPRHRDWFDSGCLAGLLKVFGLSKAGRSCSKPRAGLDAAGVRLQIGVPKPNKCSSSSEKPFEIPIGDPLFVNTGQGERYFVVNNSFKYRF
jgi:hypothetical protein